MISATDTISTTDFSENTHLHLQRLRDSGIPIGIPIYDTEQRCWLGVVLNIPAIQQHDPSVTDEDLAKIEKQARSNLPRKSKTVLEDFAEMLDQFKAVQNGLEPDQTKGLYIYTDEFGLCGKAIIVHPSYTPEFSKGKTVIVFVCGEGSSTKPMVGYDPRPEDEIQKYGILPRWVP